MRRRGYQPSIAQSTTVSARLHAENSSSTVVSPSKRNEAGYCKKFQWKIATKVPGCLLSQSTTPPPTTDGKCSTSAWPITSLQYTDNSATGRWITSISAAQPLLARVAPDRSESHDAVNKSIVDPILRQKVFFC